MKRMILIAIIALGAISCSKEENQPTPINEAGHLLTVKVDSKQVNSNTISVEITLNSAVNVNDEDITSMKESNNAIIKFSSTDKRSIVLSKNITFTTPFKYGIYVKVGSVYDEIEAYSTPGTDTFNYD